MNKINKIKKARLEAKLTQKELGELIKVSEQHIQKWEYGKIIPNGKNLIKLANILKISPEDLLE